MKTLRKIAIVSACILLICMIATAVLIPTAIGDTQRLSRELDKTYGQLTEELTVTGDGVKLVSLKGGYVGRLRLHTSPDDSIHLYVTGYLVGEPSFPFSLSGDGNLQISYIQDNGNFFTTFTRENLLRSMAANFNNVGMNDMELYLPTGVAFDLSGHSVWRVEADPDVATLFSGDEEETAQSDELPISSQDGTGAKEILQIGSELREENDRMMRLYQRFYDGELSEDELSAEMNASLSQVSRLLSRAIGEETGSVWEERFYNLGELQMQKNAVELSTDRNQAMYQRGKLTKEEFYAMDLALDEMDEQLDSRLENYRDDFEKIKSVEREINVDTILDEDIGYDELKVYKYI